MKLTHIFITILAVLGAIMASIAQEAEAIDPATMPVPAATDVVQMINKDAKIDWTLFQFRAVGIGVAPENATGGSAKAMAREAAITIAERNLLKVVQGVHITSETTVENLVLTSDIIKTNLEGVLIGAVVVQEVDLNDGSYKVVVAMPLLGEQGVAKAIDLPKQVEDAAPTKEVILADLPAPTMLKGNFTGLLIDCRGLKVSPAMAPVVYGPDDEAIYPRSDVNINEMIANGLVAYYNSAEIAIKAGRVGNRPLIIKASSIKKAANGWNTSPILTQADSARILAEDARTGFITKLAVGFIID